MAAVLAVLVSAGVAALAAPLASGAPPPTPTTPGGAPDVAAAGRFAALALKCLHLEYPSHISHTLTSAADVLPPQQLTPAFYGCYDWHSDVHGHWLLVRLLRLYPRAPFAAEARGALAQSLTEQNISGEVAYLRGAGRASFERPYGLAWLLQLAAELRHFDDPEARRWSAALAPLESAAAARLASWLPKLNYPILGDPSLGAAPAPSGGLVSDMMSAANQLGAGQAIDLLKGMILPQLQNAAHGAAAPVPPPPVPAPLP